MTLVNIFYILAIIWMLISLILVIGLGLASIVLVRKLSRGVDTATDSVVGTSQFIQQKLLKPATILPLLTPILSLLAQHLLKKNKQ